MKYLICLFLAIIGSLHGAEMTDAAALAFLQKHTPEIHQKVAPLAKTDPEDFRSAMDEAKAAAAEFDKITLAGDPAAAAAHLKMYALDFQSISVADLILKATDDAEKTKLNQQLQSLIAASLEQWTIVEQARIGRMETALAKLKTDFEAVLADKAKTIAKDTAALIEECRQYQNSKRKKSP